MNDDTSLVPIRRALISVSDKTGLVDLASALCERGVELVSTGGSARMLRDAGYSVRDVSEVTGVAEMMDGRVKTLHPKIHGGLLALRDATSHIEAMRSHGIAPIDLLVVNLYPFEETVAAGAEAADCVENIDIGGPAMIRAAAKNHRFVTPVVDPEDYDALLLELNANGNATSLEFRRKLAQIAFSHTAAYDAAVSAWMAGKIGDVTPRRHVLAGRIAQSLRYGENPHQRAAFYHDASARVGVATAQQLQGKELSYNNLNDTDAAFELAAEFGPDDGAACVIVKHANPCGVARADTLLGAYRAAFDCDRTSAFGGIVAFNRPLDEETARAITSIFTEVVIAPGVTDGALSVFAEKKNLRLLATQTMPDPRAPAQIARQLAGGFLVQDKDVGAIAPDDLRVVTKRAPSADEMEDLLFAWRVAKHVKSNAIVYAKDGATVGIGAGQMSRVDSAQIAARKAERAANERGLGAPLTQGSAVASDAFFPFADGVLELARAGASSVIQPGGAMRDEDVIAAADAAGLAMVFTGMRHFRH